MKDIIPFLSSHAHPIVTYAFFFHFSGICNLGCNGLGNIVIFDSLLDVFDSLVGWPPLQ
jgi:hypothetical protein